MTTQEESKMIAEKIHQVECSYDLESRREFFTKDKWQIFEDKENARYFTLERSKDCMMWYIWKGVTYERRSFWKAVPMMELTVDQICDILNAERWLWI